MLTATPDPRATTRCRRLRRERPRLRVRDEILTTRNDYRVGVRNGTRGRISDIDHSRGELRINADGHEVMLPQSYVAAGRVTHVYAATFHKAQGMTTRDAFILVDNTLDRERACTGLFAVPTTTASTSPTLPTNAPERTHPNEPTTPSHEHANRCDTASPNQWPSTSTTRTELKPADQFPAPRAGDAGPDRVQTQPLRRSCRPGPHDLLRRDPCAVSARIAYLNTHAERQIWRVRSVHVGIDSATVEGRCVPERSVAVRSEGMQCVRRHHDYIACCRDDVNGRRRYRHRAPQTRRTPRPRGGDAPAC